MEIVSPIEDLRDLFRRLTGEQLCITLHRLLQSLPLEGGALLERHGLPFRRKFPADFQHCLRREAHADRIVKLRPFGWFFAI